MSDDALRPAPPARPNRCQVPVAVVLGVAVVGLAGYLAVEMPPWARGREVRVLLAALKVDPTTADAAFKKLRALPDERLGELIPFVESEEATSLVLKLQVEARAGPIFGYGDARQIVIDHPTMGWVAGYILLKARPRMSRKTRAEFQEATDEHIEMKKRVEEFEGSYRW